MWKLKYRNKSMKRELHKWEELQLQVRTTSRELSAGPIKPCYRQEPQAGWSMTVTAHSQTWQLAREEGSVADDAWHMKTLVHPIEAEKYEGLCLQSSIHLHDPKGYLDVKKEYTKHCPGQRVKTTNNIWNYAKHKTVVGLQSPRLWYHNVASSLLPLPLWVSKGYGLSAIRIRVQQGETPGFFGHCH